MSGLDSLIAPMFAQAFGSSPLTQLVMQDLFPSGGARALNGRPGVGSSDGSTQGNIDLAKRMAARRGWTGQEWRDLKQLWMHESGFNDEAANPTSSARGIPQAMMSVHFGDNWQNSNAAQKFLNNPRRQIGWGLDYIAGRYNDPSTAWDHWLAAHSY